VVDQIAGNQQPWTTYQLARQMERSLGWIWPRAVSRLYGEPKKLVAAGLATSWPGATGRRRSTIYSITPHGRQALSAWLAEPGAGPVLECEALVKIAYADQGAREGLLANLTALIDDTTAKLHFGEMIAQHYLDGLGPFQERLPYSGLMWRFLWEYHLRPAGPRPGTETAQERRRNGQARRGPAVRQPFCSMSCVWAVSSVPR
jgi:PadR family transcriptional regulator AphA